MGYDIVNVAQKLDVNISSKGNVSISAATDIFPSAKLSVNGSTIMQYNQPSFKATHTAGAKTNFQDNGAGGVMTGKIYNLQPDIKDYKMLQPNIKNIIVFFLIKCFLFYILLMFKNNDYSLIQIGRLKNFEDVFYYLWLFLFRVWFLRDIFSVPLYFFLKSRNSIYFSLLTVGFLIAEYFLYTHFSSQGDLMNGILKQ